MLNQFVYSSKQFSKISTKRNHCVSPVDSLRRCLSTMTPYAKESSQETLSLDHLRWDPSAPVETARLPPSFWYTDPKIFQKEMDTVFKRNWVHVGRVDQVASPGQYFAGTLFGDRFIVARDLKGKLQSFHNVCRHHAAHVVEEGEGQTQEFRCCYHGWTYEMDGRLRLAPQIKGIQDFKSRDFGLFPIHVETFGPWIFLNFSRQTPEPLGTQLSQLGIELENLGMTNLKFIKQVEYEVDCNWKVYVDNYLDGGYHVASLHKDLGGLLDLKNYKTTLYEKYSIQSCSKSDAEPSTDLKDFPERVGSNVVYGWVYPNFMINRYGHIMDTNTVIPISQNKTKVAFGQISS
eukprot:TRINITY_DN7597_c2_g2_i1.p1 TRINITY_DN7597_c2_g2~~TRINITY_DN7597_c2_g2_i1.p1  ORF type:complete len:347 (+),score=83.67 TRINITY_DN7597_c2_g2_i1:437-1477(+)